MSEPRRRFPLPEPVECRYTKLGGLWVQRITAVHIARHTDHLGPLLALECDLTDKHGTYQCTALADLRRLHVESYRGKDELAGIAQACRELYGSTTPTPAPEPPKRELLPEPRDPVQAVLQKVMHCPKAAPCGANGCEGPEWGGCALRRTSAASP